MSATDGPRGKIEIGGVIRDTFAVIGRNFVTFFVLSLLLTGLPTAVFGYAEVEMGQGSGMTSVMGLLSVLVSLVTGAVLQATLMHGTVTDMNGRRAAISESLAVGMRAFLPLIAIGLLMGIAIAAGFILLIVPGVWMMLAWAVVVPAYVAERTGIFEAFSRSARLTSGNRWRILGLSLLYFFAVVVVLILLGVVFGVIRMAMDDDALLDNVLLTPIFTALYTLVGAVGGAVLYAHLRRAKEGLAPDALAAIFD